MSRFLVAVATLAIRAGLVDSAAAAQTDPGAVPAYQREERGT
jgi:hypothetical protein